MWDLVFAVALVVAGATVSFMAGRQVACRCSAGSTLAVSAVALSVLLVFLFRFHGTLPMARLIPLSNVVILANWIPLFGGLFAGILFGQTNSSRWRRTSLALMVILVSTYSLLCGFQGMLSREDVAHDSWPPSPQSEPSTCGPCCVARMLREHGIAATEAEMLRMCLTTHRGSPALGLYRGLKLKTAGTGWDVEVVSCSVEDLLEMPGPILLRITFPHRIVMAEKRVTRERLKVQHAVLFKGTDDAGRAVVFDPAIADHAQRPWTTEQLEEMWTGEGLRLVTSVAPGKTPESPRRQGAHEGSAYSIVPE